VLLLAALSGCGGGSGPVDPQNPDPDPDPSPVTLDSRLGELARTTLGLNGDPSSRRGLQQTAPADDPMVKLGELLFFSQTLSAGYDVSCGTCHHPQFGGSDGLSLPVGVVPTNSATVGPGREVDPARDLDPAADGGPNLGRNSITTFNAALFDREQMYDGRVFVVDSAVVSGGHGQNIRTPESGQAYDSSPLDGLVQFTMKGPMVADNEMRGYLYTDYATPTAYREHLAQRLRGEVDAQYNTKSNAADVWLQRFRDAFGLPAATADELITRLNIQRALAAYVQSQIFVDTQWQDYLAGDTNAISTEAKQGALLFFTPRQDGGLGCNSCHAGDRFTDEAFHNVALPQFGRGMVRSDHSDLGRWLVTRADDDLQAFRTSSLLNVARTAPYGHTGAFSTLEALLAYHANPRSAVDTYDFTLASLDQFRRGGVVYPNAETYTREALAQPNFAAAEALLPGRALSSTEINQLVAFLDALTDRCVADPACIGKWAPTAAEDPDGHTLVMNQSQGTPGDIDAPQPEDYPQQIGLTYPALAARSTFADVQACSNNVNSAANTGQDQFARRSETAFGLVDRHGYGVDTWFSTFQPSLEVAMIGGGVSAAYLDDDCWPDLVFTGGDISGMRFYRNNAGTGFSALDLIPAGSEREYTGAGVADLNGDYRRELLLGNIRIGSIPIYSPNGTGQYDQIGALPMVRPTFGMSFAPLDDDDRMYMYLGHWSGGTGTTGTSPALWQFDAGNAHPWDSSAQTTSANLDQNFNFTPKFADFTGDGRIDLVIASDFDTSATLRNVSDGPGAWHFQNETDRDVITDDNGMGSALLDIDNDGTLEWFVTSVRDSSGDPLGNWGVSGNRLYRNISTGEHIAFTDITEQAGVRDGYWGWGACAADFNNDGFIDLFHVNGFGYIPDDVADASSEGYLQEAYNGKTAQFQGTPARLFINDGDGTFSERATDWGIDAPSEGRGVVCFDYDRDGDVDITVFDHSRQLQFFENRGGSGAGRHFLNIRVVGAAPNTDAIGARVYVTADVGAGHGVQTQLRLAEANSNFNSQNLPDLHFGLGAAAAVQQVRVVWPGGAELTCPDVAVNQFLVLDQRDGAAACPAPGP
jgi:cytochrome c peroxidase